ncbi:MAG: PAS domain S-box protein, partial [Verrucomicrobiae bacterium]|nr:PAS domain S-box protein [Verrucomicrobiae bacterium]
GYGREEVIGRLLTDFLTEPSRAAFEKEFSRFRDDSKVTAYEMEFRCKNGTIRTVAVQGVFVHDEQGRPLQGHCILQDISEHKRLESVRKALLSLARELSEAGSKVDVARCIFSTADRLWQWDAGALEMVNSDAFTGETVLAVDRIDGERREVSVQQMHSSLSPLVQQVVRTGPVLILRNEDETRAKDLTGLMEVGRMARSVMAVPVKHRGRVLAVISIQSYAGDAFDKEDLRILEGVADHCSGSLARVETTEKLRQSQNRLSLAIEGTGLGIWDWDLVTGRIVWEGHHARLFGLKPEEFDGTYAGFEARVHPEDREKIASAVKRALENREAYSCEYRVVWPDGSVHWIVGHGQFTYDDQGRAVRMVGVVRETTEQHLAEERLRESEQRFRSLYDNAVVGIYRTTPDGRILLANPAVVRMLGYSSFEELATLNLEKEGFHPQFPRKIFKEAVERNGYVHGLEGAWVRKDGSIVYVRESAQAIRDANGNILYYDGTVEDITEYLKARMELERQAALLEAATDAIHARTLDGTITYWNKASEAILGWDRGEAIGRKITALAVKDPVAFAAAEAALVEKGSWSGELQFTTKSGKTLTMFCRWTLVPAQGDRSPEVLAIQSDITEKRELELRFLRAQRLEGIGALASGIAHDLNNILAPIVMGVSLLRDKSTDPEFQSGLETIESSAQRGANIVRQLLTFARGLKGERMPIQLQHVVRDVGRLIRETFPRNITYREVCPGDLWPIIGDPTQIQQVLLNLCVNARDAMPAGGDLSITVSNKQVDRQFLCSVAPDVHEGPFVVIEVRDTGHGMTPDIMEHLFEPFFTTKEPGTGTGLGLATSLGIVRNHGGFIVVNSTPGEGSVFTVYLPASPEAMTPPAAEAQTAPIGKGEVILVVDDEASVREITKRTLEKHGYRVLVAEDGAAAVTLYANYRERIDVVLTDLLMPIMDGVGLATAIRRMDPKLPIIVSTGDPASPSQKAKLLQLEKLGVTVCLLKPYNTPQLLRTLHSVLHPS